MPRYREKLHLVEYAGKPLNSITAWKLLKTISEKKSSCWLCNEDYIECLIIDCDKHTLKDNKAYLQEAYKAIREYEQQRPIDKIGSKYKDRNNEE